MQFPQFDLLRARARRRIVAAAALRAALVLVVWAVVGGALDRWFRLEPGWRVGVLLTVLAAVGWQLWRAGYRPLQQALDDAELALAVERTDPGLKQELVSAVQFRGGVPANESAAMVAQVMVRAEAAADRIGFSRALDPRQLRRMVLGWCAVFSAVVLAPILSPEIWSIWVQRMVFLQEVPWPSATRLQFLAPALSPLRHPRGEDLLVEVEASGELPDGAILEVEAAGQRQRVDMLQVGAGATERVRRYRARLPAVQQPLRLQAFAGDGSTVVQRVELAERPRLLELELTVVPPAYTGLPEVAVQPDPGINTPAFSELVVRGRCDVPLSLAELAWIPAAASAEGRREPVALALELDGQGAMTGRMMLQHPGTLQLRWIDREGLMGGKPIRWPLLVQPDAPPQSALGVVGIGSMITTSARLPLQVEATDDHGLEAVTLQAAFGQDAAATSPGTGEAVRNARLASAPGARGPREWRTTWTLDLVELEQRPVPGDTLFLQVVVQDGRLVPARSLGAQPGFSAPLVIQVVADDVLAEDLQRRLTEQGAQLERMAGDIAILGADGKALGEGGADPLLGRVLQRRADLLQPQLAGVAHRTSEVLAEYGNNRLLPADRVAFLRARIPAPLEVMADANCPAVSRAMTRWVASGGSDGGDALQQELQVLLDGIADVLLSLQSGSSLAAAVEELREVIRLQDAVLEAAATRLEAAGADIFGDPQGGRK